MPSVIIHLLGILGLVNPAHADPFLWGVGNSAFQVEGSPVDSDWLRWTHVSGHVADGTNADRATDFLHRYDEDFAWAQSLGLNSFRVSLAWERIEPREGEFDPLAIETYRRMIQAMRTHGLEPVVTLQHFALPGWLSDRGGVLAEDFPRVFAEYARTAVSALSEGPQGVRIWLTMNEPMVMVLGGYMGGGLPPGHTDLNEANLAAAHLAIAHLEATRAIRALGSPEVRVSIAHHWLALAPANNASPEDRFWSSQVEQSFNRDFVDAVMTGVIHFGVLPPAQTQAVVPLPDGKPGLDFLGLNYYQRVLIQAQPTAPFFVPLPGPGPKSDVGWEIYPQGMTDALVAAYGLWHLPILITENGIADATDSQRSDFLEKNVAAVFKAEDSGVPVLGYLHWSLTDNFEWLQGEKARFGLMEVDYASGTRTPRASYFTYGRIVREAQRAPRAPRAPGSPGS